MRPIQGADAVILGKLLQLVGICRRNNLGTAADVVRIAEAHLQHPHTLRRAYTQQKARADALETEVQRLRAITARYQPDADQWQPPRTRPARTAELTPRTARALTEMCAGATLDDVAQHLGLGYSSAVNLCNRAVHDLGARDRAQAIALVTSGAVQVHVRRQIRREKAA